MVQDRHTDPDCEVFTTPEQAIDYARRFAAGYPDAVEEPMAGLLYYAKLTVEEDAVWVVEKDLHGEHEHAAA
jgi:hypothetical protein